MADRFCSQCGAELVAGAGFCVECGRSLSGAGRTTRPILRTGRVAPLLVFGAVVLIGAVAIGIGRYYERPAPSVPGRAAPPAATGAGTNLDAAANLGGAHPPVELPQDIRDMIAGIRKEAEGDPENAEKWRRLAGVEYRAGQLDRSYLARADASYQRVLELQPEDPEALRSLGNLAFDREAKDDAIRFYERYIEQKPDDLNVQTDMATMYMAKGDMKTAVELYDKVLEQKPDFFEALFNLGLAYRDQGRMDEALEMLRRAQKAAPDERMSSHVEVVIARATGVTEPPHAVAPAPADAAPGAAEKTEETAVQGSATPFQQAVEAIFRAHPMVGPKLAELDWEGERRLRVRLNDFPVNAMPEEIRERFNDRIRQHVQSSKEGYGVTGAVEVELVDAASGAVMETISN